VEPRQTDHSTPALGCDCIRLIAEAFERENLNTEVVTSLVINIPTGEYRGVRISIPTRKKDSRSRERARLLIAQYCPLCGTRYPNDDAARRPADGG
jgi:hypothetical protein